jgi:hypothetical protein
MNYLFRVIFLCSLVAGPLFAQSDIRGTVVAVHTTSQSRFIPGYAGGDGIVASPGVSVKYVNQIYRVETETKFYEIEGSRKAVLILGDSVNLRIEKGKAVVLIGGKERKLRIVGEELKSR